MTNTTAVALGPVEYRPRLNVTIRLTPDEIDTIDRYAEADGRSRSSFIRRIIAGAIQRQSQ